MIPRERWSNGNPEEDLELKLVDVDGGALVDYDSLVALLEAHGYDRVEEDEEESVDQKIWEAEYDGDAI